MRQLRSNQQGSVMVLFALMLIPLVVMIGAAVDLTRLLTIRDQLQQAVEAAALAGVRNQQTESRREEAIRAYFAANWEANQHKARLGRFFVMADPPTGRLYIDVTAYVPLYFMRLVGHREQEVHAQILVKPAPAP